MKKTIFFTVLLFFSIEESIAKPQISVEFESDTHSDIASVDQVLDRLKGPEVESGSFAFSHSEISQTTSWENWDVQFFRRLDYYFDTNADTARIFWLNNNDIPITETRSYNIDLDVNSISARGLSLAYRGSFGDDFKYRLGIDYLKASELTEANLSGLMTTNDEGYQGTLSLDYSYTKDALLDRTPEKVLGEGFSFDLSAAWRLNSSYSLELEAKDLFSEVYWSDVTFTRAVATTDTVFYDEDGSLSSVPILSGVESYRDVTQRLPIRARAALDYSHSSWRNSALTVSLSSYDRHPFLAFGYAMNVLGYDVRAVYNYTRQAIGLGLDSGRFNMRLGLDSFDWNKMTSINLNIGARIF